MIPTVDFFGSNVSRLIIGANPFGGFSHQNKMRDEEMLSYYTTERILETWERAERAGINTMITNNETPHVLSAVKEYLSSGGSLQWIAQVAVRDQSTIYKAIDEVVSMGCIALFFHGSYADQLYKESDIKKLQNWSEYAKQAGIPVGVAGHSPDAHLWINKFDIVDFHVISFFNCGSLHDGYGGKFKLEDMQYAANCVQKIKKPCIAYKIMGAGRIDPYMAFEYAFSKIKPGDMVNVGMYRGDKDNIVEENVKIVREILLSNQQ